jgi:uncharacterized iron-regulated protein
MKKLLVLICLGSSVLFTACSKDDGPITQEANYTEVLNNLGQNIILETYKALALKAAAMHTAVETLENNPTQANLEAARLAWTAARSPWEQSEGFLFGPVDQEGLDPALDSWPVNVTDLENVLNSSNALTINFLSQQEGTLKGFHTIEFLLWGATGQKQLGSFTTREFEYLTAASGLLAENTGQLYDLWNPTGGNFIANVLNAGNGSAIYISQKSALEEITNALLVIADEVGNGKINDPFSQKDLSLEESRFSANSKADFADNMRSVRNIYTGQFGTFGNGNSLSDVIKAKNAAVDTELTAAIETAIQSIEQIPGTFSTAIFDHPDAVAAAQAAVRNLQSILESKVLPIVSNL